MNTIINETDYGPLAQLVGKWIGNKGKDVAPDSDGEADNTDFTDEIVFTPSGPAENAEEQNVVSLRYHHVVRKKENGRIFHDQIGHWIYEKSTNTIMHSLSIPRGVCVLAGGQYQSNDDGTSIFNVTANADDKTYGIIQSPFMLEKAKTNFFTMNLSVKGDELKYNEMMMLEIYGKSFTHTDSSELKRVIYD